MLGVGLLPVLLLFAVWVVFLQALKAVYIAVQAK